LPGRIGTSCRLKSVFGKISYTKEVFNMVSSLRKLPSSEVASESSVSKTAPGS